MMLGTSLRSWRKSPLLTAQFSITIAIGMGAAAALVSLMLALGYEPLPYRDPGRLVAVWERAESGAQFMGLSGPDLMDFADATPSTFAALGGFTPPHLLWLHDLKGATRVSACYIQPSVLSDLGIRPVLGREVRPDDEPADGSGTAPAWISYGLWQNRYGGSPSVIGETIGFASSATGSDQMRLRIAGVLPPRVSIPLPFESTADVWYVTEGNLANHPRAGAIFFGVGRLRPGVSTAQAQAALTAVAERLEQRFSFERRRRPVVRSFEEIAQGPVRQTMGLLALGVALVFVVGCVNLAILMGAEGRRRRREIAIRAVLGAGRWQLWSEVAAEKWLLTLLSLGLGVVFASALLRVLTQLVPAAGLGPPLAQTPPLNLVVLLGFAAFALAAALVWSALLVAAADGPGTSRALAAAGGGPGYTGFADSSPRAGRWRLVLLAAQVGAGIWLLAAATLAAKTYATLSAANLGPAPSRTVLFSVDTHNVKLPEAQAADCERQILDRLGRLPGTQAIALADRFPPYGSPTSFMKEGDAPGTSRAATAPTHVLPGYFRILGIPILFGRDFDDTDHIGGEPVAIISRDMAELNWTSPQQAVGSEIAVGSKFQDHYKIIGVAGNFTGYWSQKPVPTIYLDEAQDEGNWCSADIILRTAGSAKSVVALAPQAPDGMEIPAEISDVSTLQARWQATLTRPLARMAGMLLLALLGLGLSVQGVYAVAAATAAARRHELAVRSALGAPPNRLVWNVTRDLVLAVTVGAGFGVVAALDLHRLLKQWLGPAAVGQTEPILVAVVLLTLAAAAGCYFPAQSAVRANPAEVLRQG
jgi:putative ABC transport system permease protein